MAKLILTYRDYNEPTIETSTAVFTGSDLTSLNFDAEETLMDSLKTAVEALSNGTLIKDERVAKVSPYPKTRPGTAYAQRENKWLVRYRDTVTGDIGRLELPVADLSLLTGLDNGDFLDLSGTEAAAFVTAFNNYQLSPGSGTRGNTAVVSIQFVGRNS